MYLLLLLFVLISLNKIDYHTYIIIMIIQHEIMVLHNNKHHLKCSKTKPLLFHRPHASQMLPLSSGGRSFDERCKAFQQ